MQFAKYPSLLSLLFPLDALGRYMNPSGLCVSSPLIDGDVCAHALLGQLAIGGLRGYV